MPGTRAALLTLTCVGWACSSGSAPKPKAKTESTAAQADPEPKEAPVTSGTTSVAPTDPDPTNDQEMDESTSDETGGTDETDDTTDGPLQPATALQEGDKADEVLNAPGEEAPGKLATPEIADVGKHAFEAIKANDADKLMELTPFGNAAVKEACPELSGPESALEVKARMKYCYKQIAWDTVTEARMGGGEPTGASAEGCASDVQELERLRMLVKTPAQNWEIDLMGAVGRDGKAIGFSGEVACRKSDR